MTAKSNSEEGLAARTVSELDDDFNRGEFERRRTDDADRGQAPATSGEAEVEAKAATSG